MQSLFFSTHRHFSLLMAHLLDWSFAIPLRLTHSQFNGLCRWILLFQFELNTHTQKKVFNSRILIWMQSKFVTLQIIILGGLCVWSFFSIFVWLLCVAFSLFIIRQTMNDLELALLVDGLEVYFNYYVLNEAPHWQTIAASYDGRLFWSKRIEKVKFFSRSMKRKSTKKRRGIMLRVTFDEMEKPSV